MTIAVLFVDHADFLGGAEQSELELLRLLNGERFELILACPDGALAAAARAQGTRVISLDMRQVRGVKNFWSAPFKVFAGVRALVRIIRSEQIDIVHSNTMRASIYAALAAKWSGAKFVWHVHDLYRERLYVRVMASLADAILTNSRGAARLLPASVQPKTTVVYHGVQAAQFDPRAIDRDAIRAAWNVRRDQLLIGNVGWFAPWKGQRDFIEVCALIATRCPDACFVMVGAASDARYDEYARELCALGAAQLGDKLIWAGARRDVANVMSALDLLLHCAEREPFGRVLIEAMAMRVPVLAYRGGGPDEIVADGETGYLVPPRDTQSMADAALAILRDPERRRRMGESARARALGLYAPERNVHLVEDVYARLGAKHS